MIILCHLFWSSYQLLTVNYYNFAAKASVLVSIARGHGPKYNYLLWFNKSVYFSLCPCAWIENLSCKLFEVHVFCRILEKNKISLNHIFLVSQLRPESFFNGTTYMTCKIQNYMYFFKLWNDTNSLYLIAKFLNNLVWTWTFVLNIN